MADLIFGAKNGSLEKVKQQLNLGVDVNHREQKDGTTALYWSACSGHSSVISELLKVNADVNLTVNWGSTALHAAADRGYTQCMKLLLEHNADPNIVNHNGDAPLHLAAFRGHLEACLILLKFNVDVAIPNKGGKTAKQEALSAQHFDVAKILDEKSKDRLASSFPQYKPNIIVGGRRLQGYGYSSSDQELKNPKYNIKPDSRRYGGNIEGLPVRTDPVFGDTRDVIPAVSSRNQPLHKTFSAPPSPSETSSSNKMREGGSYGNYAISVPNQEAREIIDDLQLKLAMAESEKDDLKSKMEKVAEKRYFDNSSSASSIEFNTIKSELALTKQALTNSEKKYKQLENLLADQKQFISNPLNNLSGIIDESPHNVASASRNAHFGIHLIKAMSVIGKMFSSKDTNLFPIISKSFENVSSENIQLYQQKLLDHLKKGKVNFNKWCNYKLDKPGQVWTLGSHYKLVQKSQFTKVVNCLLTRHTSVAFEIFHQDKKYLMKVMPMQSDGQNLSFFGRDPKNSSFRSFNAVKNELEVFLNVPSHSNLASVLHHFEIPLRKLDHNLSILIDQRAVMAVMPDYLMTLSKLMTVQQQNPSLPFALSETFFQQVVLQMLKALSHLQEHNVAHRDIKPESIYITDSLRVVLGGFRMAIKLTESNGQPIQFTDKNQVGAGNPLAWTPELKKWEKDGPPKTWQRKIMLNQLYENSDIYNLGRMMLSLMKQERHDTEFASNMIYPCSMTDWRDVPARYSKSFTDLLQEMFANDSQSRPTLKEAILRVSMMLYGPKVDEIQSESDCELWVISQISRLVAQTPDVKDKTCSSMSTEELGHALDWQLCSDYLTEVFGNELWQLICSLRHTSYHRKEINF